MFTRDAGHTFNNFTIQNVRLVMQVKNKNELQK